MNLKNPKISTLGRDPARTHRINANSFQQNALTTSNGWQYAAFYTDKMTPDESIGKCFVNLARRSLSEVEDQSSEWSTLTFEDYEQITDDGHNTISMGVCEGDGTIHLAFDHHCNELNFRISNQKIALEPSKHQWNASLFSRTQNFLPGLVANDLVKEVTYPWVVDSQIFRAGAGSDVLYRYSSTTHQYTYIGQHLTGISNNPYINGIDYRLSRLHLSWCYRNFVVLPASSAPNAHKQQAGPNGPENNFDLNYAFSDDSGQTWRSTDNQLLADLRDQRDEDVKASIMPGEGARVFEIPMHSGLLNQEGQTADWDGGFWVLNRERISGVMTWMVYHRDSNGRWTKTVLESATRPTDIGARGCICVDRQRNVYIILPGNLDSSLEIMRAEKERGYAEFKQVWLGSGFDGEPLVDNTRLEMVDELSIFTRTSKTESGAGDVVVLDFSLKYSASSAPGSEVPEDKDLPSAGHGRR